MSKFCYKCEKDVDLVKDPDSNAQLCAICGVILIHSASKLPEGTVIGGFEIESEIGRGGMGIVYKAKQLNLERHVALKVLADDLSRDIEFVENFFKEARAAASLNHPNIVQIFDAGSTPEGIYYFAMELIVGETLEARISRDGSLDSKEAIRVAIKIADAMGYSWESQKLTHGDIKPENIILDSSGGTKVADLGLAKFMHEDKSKGAIMATPLYAPPEVIKGQFEKISCQADMYSFGITLFQMLTGVTPFPDDAPEKVFKNHLETVPPLISSYNPRFTPLLVQLVNQLLEKDPSERPLSWSDIGKALIKIRQPEIEGKIFHTHHTDTSSNHIVSPHAQDDGVGGNNFRPLINILLAVVVGLSIAVAIVVYYDRKTPSRPEIGTLLAEDLTRAQEAVEKLEDLKKQLEFLSPKHALLQVERFIALYGENSPDEARVMLERLKAQLAQASSPKETRTSGTSEFSAQVEKVIREISSAAPFKDVTSTDRLQALSQSIESLLSASSGNPDLVISRDDRDTLNDAYMKLSEALMEHRRKKEEIARKLAEEERLKKIQEERLKKEQAEIKRVEDIRFNRAVDEFYIAIAKYLRLPRTDDLEASLVSWRTARTLPAAYSMKAEFLVEKVIPDSRRFVALMVRNIEAFKGQGIPLSVCPSKLRKYTVKDIDDTGIRMMLSDGKVTLGQTLNWSTMPPKLTAEFIKERLLLTQDGRFLLPEEDIRVVLAHILLNDHASIEEVAAMTLKDNQEKRIWESLSKDFAIAENEARMAVRMAQIRDLYDNGDKVKASELIASLYQDSSGTEFGRRYATDLKNFFDTMLSVNPAVAAAQMLGRLNDLVAHETPMVLMAFCNTIEARYAKIIEPEKLAEVRGVRDSALQSIVEASQVKDLNSNRVPFYYWEMEKTGDAWAYYKITLDSGKMGQAPKVLKAMELAAALDNGDWTLAKSILDSGEALDIEGLAKMTRTRAWASSFIFARGLLGLQFPDPVQRDLALTSLFMLSRQVEHPIMSPVSTALAMEFAILARQFPRAITASLEYNYRLGPTAGIEAKVAFLGLLAAIDKDSSTVEDIEKIFNKISSVDRLSDIAGGDLMWCRTAVSLVKGDDPARNLEKLNDFPCRFPDVSARILLAATARRYCSKHPGLQPNMEQLLIKTVASQIKDMTVASETWRRLAVFNAARMNSPTSFSEAMSNSLDDHRLCALSSYPLVISLKTAAEISSAKSSRMETKSNLARFQGASTVVSKADSVAIDIITAEDPAATVRRIYMDNLPDKAFLAAVVGIMANYQQPDVRASIVKVLNENYSFLTWEERFLIGQIQNWR
ncbi:MAG: protein kinase [Victivallales bacterium]|nr:protein kinase [Victivallales bacterium]